MDQIQESEYTNMALTDEQKAKLIAGDVDEATQDETTNTTQDDQTVTTDQKDQTAEEEAVEDKSEEEQSDTETTTEEEAAPTFTKQFPNLKGESWEDYGKNLEVAYDNSFKEALRIKKQNDDNAKVIEEAKKIIAANGQPAEGAASQPAATPSAVDMSALPEIQYIRAQQQNDMITAFDKFAKDYPQARDADSFSQFQKASDGVHAAFTAANGRTPTYPELFASIANVLSWQSAKVEGNRANAIKDNAASTQINSAARPTSSRPKVTDKQVDTYLRMFPNRSRADVIKELSQIVA